MVNKGLWHCVGGSSNASGTVAVQCGPLCGSGTAGCRVVAERPAALWLQIDLLLRGSNRAGCPVASLIVSRLQRSPLFQQKKIPKILLENFCWKIFLLEMPGGRRAGCIVPARSVLVPQRVLHGAVGCNGTGKGTTLSCTHDEGQRGTDKGKRMGRGRGMGRGEGVDRKWVENGSEMCFSKNDLGAFGVPKHAKCAHCESSLAPLKSRNALKMGCLGTKNGSKIGQKCVFPKIILGHLGHVNK